jgi:enamine deaminase RidA (YjgF/YER057c/UK114 family)
MRSAFFITCALAVLLQGPVQAADVIRRQAGDFPIASSVRVPAGSEIVFLSGTLADVVNADAPAGSVERFGDTETQVNSVLAKLNAELAAIGLSLADVVKMNVFMVGDPAKDGRMDFEGLMRAYTRHFGAEPPKTLPARTTVQVAALPLPGALGEIEVIAVRPAD